MPPVTRSTAGGTPASPRILPTLTADQRAALHEDFGSMRTWYNDTDGNALLPRWSHALGVDLCCVWDHRDDSGFRGNYALYVLQRDPLGRRRLFEIPEGLWDFLTGVDPDLDEPPAGRPDAAQLDAWIAEIQRNAKTRGARKALGRLPVEDGVHLAYRERWSQ